MKFLNEFLVVYSSNPTDETVTKCKVRWAKQLIKFDFIYRFPTLDMVDTSIYFNKDSVYPIMAYDYGNKWIVEGVLSHKIDDTPSYFKQNKVYLVIPSEYLELVL